CRIQPFTWPSSFTPSSLTSTQFLIGRPVMSNSLTCGSLSASSPCSSPSRTIKRVLPHAHEHVAVEKEDDSAEHLLFNNTLPSSQRLSYAFGQGFAECHPSSP